MEKRKWMECISDSIDSRKDRLIGIAENIYRNPETGFKEFKTAKLAAEELRALGLDVSELSDIPGVKATIDTGRPGPGVAILGELDSIICTGHPDCDKETGAVHACGHHAQISSLIGAAAGLLKSGVIDKLSGKIHLMAVPAEEYIEIAYRMSLREKGVIRYLGGKPELLYRGWFDDVDISMMVHAMSSDKKLGFDDSSNGCLVKSIRYIGKASHAGGAPDKGINALYAANLGLSAINALRETFREADYIRVHPIITKGGDIVNVIPADVRMETFIRGKTIDAILEANKKVNRALIGAAISMGAQVEIRDLPGYFPLNMDKNLNELAKQVMSDMVSEDEMKTWEHGTGSTDMGDLSTLMPVIQPYVGGCTGRTHGEDFKVVDPETTYVLGAHLLARVTAELLWDKADIARDIISRFKPLFRSKKEYLDFADKLFVHKILPDEETLNKLV